MVETRFGGAQARDPVPSRPLVISGFLRDAVNEIAARGYPHETCGLLVGLRNEGGTRVVRVTSAHNVTTREPARHFVVDPADYIVADEQARRDGLDIVGVWHSHPDHPARPSPRDLEAAWPEFSYLIARVERDGVTELRAWHLDLDDFVEQLLEVAP